MKKLLIGLIALGSFSVFANDKFALDCEGYSFYYRFDTDTTVRDFTKELIEVPNIIGTPFSSPAGSSLELASDESNFASLVRTAADKITVSFHKRVSENSANSYESANATFDLREGGNVEFSTYIQGRQFQLACTIVGVK